MKDLAKTVQVAFDESLLLTDHGTHQKKWYKRAFIKANPLNKSKSRLRHKIYQWIKRRQEMEKYIQDRWANSLFNIERWKKIKQMPEVSGQTLRFRRYNAV